MAAYTELAARPHGRTGLRLVLDGFDQETGRYTSDGAIRLLDSKDNEAMAWPFSKLMNHWKTKHAHAAYVPSQLRKQPGREYRYGRSVLLGEGAAFGLFLKAVNDGKLYYDPGIKLEDVSTPKPKSKKRSQFRINSRDLPRLYEASRTVDSCSLSENKNSS
ncbi:MAG: MvaI/BcnI family restriction endonuclease [Gammaproteobacteria bacterium]